LGKDFFEVSYLSKAHEYSGFLKRGKYNKNMAQNAAR